MSDLDSFAFEPGQQVQCKTRYEDVYKGEVVAFDLASKILILKSASSLPSTTGVNTNHDLHCLVLDSVSEVDILEEPPQGKCNNELPSLGTKYLNTKRMASNRERLRLVEAVGNGVSLDGISLYTSLSKKYGASDITWQDKVKIVVMNSVVISPPYKESDCKPLSSTTTLDAVNYVKSNVKKFWESCSKQKQQQSVTNNAITSTTAISKSTPAPPSQISSSTVTSTTTSATGTTT